jgi:BirA family biotin operon repressor/biotin-[acetyl-CoA-carboxylase] ligase
MDEHLMDKGSIMVQYRDYCCTIGQEVSILQGDTVRHGTALSVDSEGALVIRYEDGSTGTVNSGEVSIRGMYGYV